MMRRSAEELRETGEGSAAATSGDARAAHRERQVLIVDDDGLDRRILRDLLATSTLTDYSVVEARDQQEALLALDDGSFDVCLVDFYLGQERGTDLIRASQGRGNQTPFIVLTGSVSTEVDGVALAAGAVDFLAKSELTSSSLDRTIRFACRQAELLSQMTDQAAQDPLTGLANRLAITNGIDERLSAMRRENGYLGVLYLDLDGFKRINDTLGHAAGDRELQEIAELIRGCCRGHDLVGRHGGDEFVVAAAFSDDGIGALRLAERICHRVQARQRSTDDAVGVSVGVALTHDGDLSAGDLLWQADLAMYDAKAAGRGRVSHYDEQLRESLQERIELERDFIQALDNDRLTQEYQPIFCLKDRRIHGFEALARWIHPTRGPISPEQFVPVAEECGLSRRLTGWSLRESCRTLREVSDAFPDQEYTASVNISVDELAATGLADNVIAVLEEFSIDPRRLILEVTETASITTDDAIKELGRIFELGVGVAVDDFGTGYSSLSRIHELPLTGLKLDRSFVWSLDERGMKEVVKTVNSLATSLGIDAVAEGVENEEQLEFLRDVGYRFGQGFLVSGAVPKAELIQLLAADATK